MTSIRISLSILLALVLGTCAQPTGFATQGTGGTLVLSVTNGTSADAGSRTLVPTVTGLIKSYSVALSGPGGTQTVTSASSPITVSSLASGSWTLTVTGLDVSGQVVAQGTTTASVGSSGAVSAAVTLTFIQTGSTTGSIDISVLFPQSAGIDAVETSLAGTTVTPALTIVSAGDGINNKVTLTQTGVMVGSPVVTFLLKKAGSVLAGVTEAVWVFQNVTTTASVTVPSSNLGAVPEAPTGLTVTAQADGSLVLGWTNNSNVADAYVVSRGTSASGPFTQLGSDLAFNALSYTDASVTAGTTYYYQLWAKNRFGLSTVATGSAAALATASAPTFSLAAGSYAQTQSVTLSTSTSGASIYYTTDDTSPATSVTRVLGTSVSFLMAQGAPLKIRAIAAKSGLANSPEATVTYRRLPVIDTFAVATADVSKNISNDPTSATNTKALNVSAHSPDGAALTYSFTVSRDGLAAGNGEGAVTGSSSYTFVSGTSAGFNSITLAVSDGTNQTVSSPISIKVLGWRQLASSGGPSARVGHNAVADGIGNMYVFGGLSGGTQKNDLWKYNVATQTWSLVTTSGTAPSARTRHSGFFYTDTWGSGHMVIATGISAGTYNADVFDIILTAGSGATGLLTWTTQTSLTSTAVRTVGSVMGLIGNAVILFGGNNASGDSAWSYKSVLSTNVFSTWSFPNTTNLPGLRYGHSLVTLGTTGILYGGTTTATGYVTDPLHVLTYNQGTGLLVGTKITTSGAAPVNRYQHAAISDGTNMIIFGGQGASGVLNDVWSIPISNMSNSSVWTQLAANNTTGVTSIPAPRQFATAVFYTDSSGGRHMIIFGGQDSSSTSLNDVWDFLLP